MHICGDSEGLKRGNYEDFAGQWRDGVYNHRGGFCIWSYTPQLRSRYGAAIGEFFRDTGRPALIIYDDLSKQAVSYREVSLLRRPPEWSLSRWRVLSPQSFAGEDSEDHYEDGGEDERFARVNQTHGERWRLIDGIADHAASSRWHICLYPHERDSITDGQIFLSNLFNAGIRPAINVYFG